MYFLGIDLDGSAALIRAKSAGVEWVKSFDVKRLDTLQAFLAGKPFHVATGLPTSVILTRSLKLELKSKRAILAALPFQIEGLLQTPLDELVIKPMIRKQEVSLLIAKKTALEQHLQQCAEIGLDPDVVSCIPNALWRFAKAYLPAAQNLLLIHFGARENVLIAIENGHLTHSHAYFHDGAQDLERSVAFMRKKCPGLSQALLIGQAPQECVKEHFELLELPPAVQEIGEHAIALGLALDAQARDAKSVQLRQGIYTPLKARRRKKKLLLSYFGACAAAFVLAFGGTQLSLKSREKKLLLSLPETHSARAEEAIAEAEKKLSEERRALSPRSNIPKVSDLLAWIGSDPIFSPKEGELSIEQLRYQLISDPRKETQLRARVEMQVGYSTPSAGRHLREALQADRTMIDSSEEVKWAGEHNRARISFLLKGKGS